MSEISSQCQKSLHRKESERNLCPLTPKPVSKPDSQKGICSPLLTPISSQCQKSLHSSTDMPLSLSPSRKLSLCPLTPSLFFDASLSSLSLTHVNHVKAHASLSSLSCGASRIAPTIASTRASLSCRMCWWAVALSMPNCQAQCRQIH